MMPKISNGDAGPAIRSRRLFDSHTGSFWGVPNPGGKVAGYLPREYRDEFYAANMDYVVYSYSTPIAWHVPGEGWTVPDVKYSRTTSRHQGIVRRAIA